MSAFEVTSKYCSKDDKFSLQCDKEGKKYNNNFFNGTNLLGGSICLNKNDVYPCFY